MKKVKFIIVALLLSMQTATFAVGLDLGLELGLSNSLFRVKGDGSMIDNESGWGVGLSAKVDLPLIDVGPEIWYTKNVATVEDADLKFHSIDLPLIVSFSVLGPLQIEAGPSFSLYSSAKMSYDDQKYNMGSFKPDMGYVVGARVTILKILMVAARFNGNFSRKSVDFNGASYEMGSNSYMISVGAKF